MTRVVVAREGESYGGYVIAKGALRIEDELVPVYLRPGSDTLLGWAKVFERNDETGEITCEIEMLNDAYRWRVDRPDTDYSCFASDLSFSRSDAEDEIVAGRIREIAATLCAGFPKFLLKED